VKIQKPYYGHKTKIQERLAGVNREKTVLDKDWDDMHIKHNEVIPVQDEYCLNAIEKYKLTRPIVELTLTGPTSIRPVRTFADKMHVIEYHDKVANKFLEQLSELPQKYKNKVETITIGEFCQLIKHHKPFHEAGINFVDYDGMSCGDYKAISEVYNAVISLFDKSQVDWMILRTTFVAARYTTYLDCAYNLDFLFHDATRIGPHIKYKNYVSAAVPMLTSQYLIRRTDQITPFPKYLTKPPIQGIMP